PTTPTHLSALSLHDALPIYWRGTGLARPSLLSAGCEMSGAAIQPLNAPRIPPANDRRRQVFFAGGFASIIGVDDKSASPPLMRRSEEHTSELQSRGQLVCRL